MKVKLFFVIFLAVILVSCASTPQIGSTGTNGAIPFLVAQNEAEKQAPEEFVSCQKKTVPNIFKMGEEKETPAEITTPEPSNLEKRVSGLEKRVGKHDLILEKHSGEISGIKARLAHNYQVLADVNRRTTGLENELHLGKKLKQVEVNFQGGSWELSNLAKKKLEKAMYEDPDMVAKFIIGATDPTGSINKNKIIAHKRAEAVRNYIDSKGINILEVKIIVQTETFRYGNCHPQNRVAILHYE